MGCPPGEHRLSQAAAAVGAARLDLVHPGSWFERVRRSTPGGESTTSAIRAERSDAATPVDGNRGGCYPFRCWAPAGGGSPQFITWQAIS